MITPSKWKTVPGVLYEKGKPPLPVEQRVPDWTPEELAQITAAREARHQGRS